MRAVAWVGGIALLIMVVVWGIMAINAHEDREDRRCHEQGGERVYTKNDGYWCVIVIYK